MDSIEKRKKQLELGRVKLAKEEMELKIAEREQEISRLRDHIKIQEQKAEELEQLLGQI